MTGTPPAIRSGEEIQAALRRLVSRWQAYEGTERAEAQPFLNELIAAGRPYDPFGTAPKTFTETLDPQP